MTPEFERLIEKARRYVESLTPEEKAKMLREQGESWARAEASWPEPKYKWINGVKVYNSWEDYINA